MPEKKSLYNLAFVLLTFGCFLLLACNAIASGPLERTLYSFTLAHGDQPFDMEGLIADQSGNLYGTARSGGPQGYGVVLELSPPGVAGGLWTEKVLYNFQNSGDGVNPEGGLIFDPAGNLYGTASSGGNGGCVFELSPPGVAGGPWTETTLYQFQGGNDGRVPVGGVIRDSAGNLYGVTAYGGVSDLGTVFELSPPSMPDGSWTETILHTFTGSRGLYPGGAAPDGGLLRNAQGALFGTTVGGGQLNYGVVFKLDPPAGGKTNWHEEVLHSFTGGIDSANPFGDLAFGPGGSVYGVASKVALNGFGYGAVYQMLPPATQGDSWTETTIYTFTGGADQGIPLSVIFHGGNLYGTTGGVRGVSNQYGTVFELTPQGSTWTETTLHTFVNTDGSYPSARLLSLSGAFYGTTLYGGLGGQGVFYEVIP